MTQSLDMYTAILKIFGSLGIVLLIVFIAFYGIRRFVQRDLSGLKGKMIQILATQYLGGKKNITLLKVPGAYLLVGITNDSISLLARFNDEDLPNIPTIENKNKNTSFFSNLSFFSSNDFKDGNFHE